MRTHLDYGDMVYDVSVLDKRTIFNQDNNNILAKRVESIQYEAGRVVTGAWKSTSIEKLYNNLGWESLSDRRTFRKLCPIFETIENKFPLYLVRILDKCEYVEISKFYNKQLFKQISCRLNRYKASFFPSIISDWNELEVDIKKSRSTNILKINYLVKSGQQIILFWLTKQ